MYAFHSDGKNGWYIGTEKGLFHYEKKTRKTTEINQPAAKNPIRCFYDWGKNRVLIGCYNGLMVMDKATGKLHKLAMSGLDGRNFSSVEIVEIASDGKGGIWFASQGKGLFYFHEKQQKFDPKRIVLPQDPDKKFISIFQFLRTGNTLWMATELGIVKHELNTEKYHLYRTDHLGYTLAKDADNTIWAGGFSQGLQRYDRKKDRFENAVFLKGSIPDRDVVQITPFSNDSLWVATWSAGMYTVNLHDMSVSPLLINDEKLSRARTSYIDSEGRIWIGADNGLYKIVGNKTVHYRHDPKQEHSLSNNRIFDIAEDASGNLWVGTAKGLNRIDLATDSIFQYTQQPGLPNDFIYGVRADTRGNIWVSTNYGLSELNVETGKFKNYTEADGLQNNEFNGKAAYKDSLGYLYFGGMNGFNVFHADSIPVNHSTGKTIIEAVSLFGQPIAKNVVYADTLRFRHNENVLTFHFSALNFLLPQKNRYRFKMDGFDKNWRPITSERSTTYTNLDPGTYTFYAKGSNNDMVWGKPDSLVVIISAPWYDSLLFKIGLFLLALLLIGGWFFYRNHQQTQKNLLLQEMVQARTKELRKTNEGLNQAIETAREQKENIAFLMRELNHRVKNNLQLMTSLLDMQKANSSSATTKSNLQAAQNRLFTIAKIHDLLGSGKQQDVAYLDKFIAHLAKELIAFMETPIDLRLDLASLKVPQKHINPLGIILNELITNTIKHAFDTAQENKNISISLEQEGEFGKLTFCDNGKGLPKNETGPKKSLGLKLVHSLALKLGGRVETLPGKGTCLVIYFVL